MSAGKFVEKQLPLNTMVMCIVVIVLYTQNIDWEIYYMFMKAKWHFLTAKKSLRMPSTSH